ncbi:ABC transporter substrate-binding protein [soil metagenome]
MSQPRLAITITFAAAIAVSLAACSAEPMPVPTPSASATPSGDGVLRIGTEFPVTGAASYLGPGQAAGVEAAIREINEAGGVNGKPVEVFHRDSGDASTGKAEESFADLTTKQVDVVIGPSSSALAERLFATTAAAKVPLITPAATSVRLSELGKSGYLFRTVPSASLQGPAVAKLVNGGDKPEVALIYLSDDTGKAVRASLTAAVKKLEGSLVVDTSFTAATKDFAPIVEAVKAAAPDGVVLVSPFSAMEQNKAIIAALSAAGYGGAKLWLTSENMADYSQALPAGLVKDVNGLLEGIDPPDTFKTRVKAADPAVTSFLYAAESYDATILAALAATVAGDDGGPAVARQLRAVSSGGIKCTSFAECLSVLETRTDIDYDGLTGAISLDAQGDPSPGHYGVYRYDAGNRFVRVGAVTASR